MPDSKEVTTAVLESADPAPAPVRHYWELFATDGPADLYRGFAMDAVNVGVSVALKAAHVPDSWLPQYEAATSHLRSA